MRLLPRHRPKPPRGPARIFSAIGESRRERRTWEIGTELLARTRQSPWSLSDRLMSWVLQDPTFKTQLFRFVDVFPVLHTPETVQQHLNEYLRQPGVTLPAALSAGLAAGGLFSGTLAKAVGGQVRSMAEMFIAGRDLAQALPTLRTQWEKGIGFTLDLLGEACVSHAEAKSYRDRYAKIIEQLPDLTANWPTNDRLERDYLGAPSPRTCVSIKPSSLDGNINIVDFDGTLQRLIHEVTPLLELARAKNVLVYFDMEHHALKELIFALFRTCCEKMDFPAGIALQAYLTSADQDATQLIDWARSANRQIYVRLIKGAYWDYETVHAQYMNWPCPVWPTKPQTDTCFERLTEQFIREMPRQREEPGVKLALGTHNVRSIAHALACMEEEGLPASAAEFQVLRGMADELKTELAERGSPLREYVPIGEIIPGMGYLVRRLLENSSNEGFIRGSHQSDMTDEQLLARPAPQPQSSEPCQRPANEPHHDFSDAQQRTAFAAAVQRTPMPPRLPDCIVEMAAQAVGQAAEAFANWRDRDAEERCRCLQMAAEKMRLRRDELAAIMTRESAKPWREADADVCEAIDFCEFYALQARRLFSPKPLTDLAAERNHLVHEPRGVAVVISPWNFPLAICAGMTTAALVTGNTVVLKPAEQSTVIAHELCRALWDAGVPRDALHFVPGLGETVGAALVRDPRVALIAFTGSSAVGLDILRAAAPQEPRLPIKHVICEMGGKNAIIVDATADLDEAVQGVRSSAFSYSGQKCSACSRVIVLDAIYDTFVRRLVESARSLVVGDASQPATDVGALIDDAAAQKVAGYIDIGKSEATLATPDAAISGRRIEPHIFIDANPESRIAAEEIFGPVLSVIRARDFEEALRIANASPYKLTGGIFTRTPSHLERAKREFRVGDLYINRGITGALVGRQPFGGFGMSGLGTQAGGEEYLLQFVYPRTISENTLRRGFAPTEDQPPRK